MIENRFLMIAKFVGFLSLVAWPALATDYFVATDGKPTADGSQAQPWDLATALSHPMGIESGDNIWIRGGTYLGGFTSRLRGDKDRPITVGAVQGERVTIDCKPRNTEDDGQFIVQGEWTTYWGLEFTCSDPRRVTLESGSWPADIRRGGLTSHGSNIRFVNLIVHDTANGIGFWGNEQSGYGGEIYGCIIYHNGWRGPDRGHGHAIYAQNAQGTKRIVDNIMFNQFGYGIHCYGSDKAFLNGIHIEGNVSFNNGVLAGPQELTHDLFVGGSTAIRRLVVLNNCLHGGGLRIGYDLDVLNQGITVSDNYITGHVRCTSVPEIRFTGNTVVASGTLVHLDVPPTSTPTQPHWNSNTYFRIKAEWSAFNLFHDKQAVGLAFADWQKTLGSDTSSSYEEGAAKGVYAVVRPNKYESGRAHIAVYNWKQAESVEIDLQNVLNTGQSYRIVSVQDFYGKPVLQGTYDGRQVTLPLSPRRPVQPIGMDDFRIPVTEPIFGAYVVLPTSTVVE